MNSARHTNDKINSDGLPSEAAKKPSGPYIYTDASQRIIDELDKPEFRKDLKKNRGRRGARAALLLNLVGAIFPSDQQWLLYLIIVHYLDDFDNPMYSFSFLFTIYVWWFQRPVIAYFSLALLDRTWNLSGNDTKGRGLGFSIRHFFIWAVCLSIIGTPCQSLVPLAESIMDRQMDLRAVLLPMVPGLLDKSEDLTSINGFVPEGLGGIPMGIFFRLCQVALPNTLQWLLCAGLSFPYHKMYSIPTSVPTQKWIFCITCWWAFGIPIDVAYGLSLVNNQYLHANAHFRYFGGGSSTILEEERLGTFFFTMTCFLLRIVQWSLGIRVTIEADNSSWQLQLFWVSLLLVPPAAFLILHIRHRVQEEYDTSIFQHQKLDGIDNIRLLRLHRKPFFGDSLITCDMFHTKLDCAPQYTAISYTWGNPEFAEQILINGQVYTISPNVYSILQGKRSMWTNCILWVDSICINQLDNDEKGEQVRLMRRIFEEASSTIAWLGDHPNPKPTIDLIRKIASLNAETKPDAIISSLVAPRVHDLWFLLSSPWFERIWIVQEIAVASQPVLRYGVEEIPWEIFARAITILSACGYRNMMYIAGITSTPLPLTNGVENTLIMENLRLCCRNCDYLSVKDMLKLGLRFESSLPVDKIYGLLGIVMERNTTPIHANHSRSTDQSKKTAAHKYGERWIKATTVMRECIEILGFISGHEKRFTRQGHLLIRSPSIAVKNLLRTAKDLGKMVRNLQSDTKMFTELQLDYSEGNTAEAVYTEVTRNLIEEGDIFSFLSHAGVGQFRKLNDLPSWVPDWSGRLQTCSLPYVKVDRPAAPKTELWIEEPANLDPINGPSFEMDGKLLCMKGVRVDKIAHLFNLSYPSEKIPQDIVSKAFHIFQGRFKSYEYAFEQVLKHPRSQYPGAIEDAFWRTVIADADVLAKQPASRDHVEKWRSWIEGTKNSFPMRTAEFERRNNPGYKPSDEMRYNCGTYLWHNTLNESAGVKFAHLLTNEISPSYKSYLLNLRTPEEAPPRMCLFNQSEMFFMDYYRTAVDYTIGRQFAITEDGWIGLVPKLTKLGDGVVVLRSGEERRCFVLRMENEKSAKTKVNAKKTENSEDPVNTVNIENGEMKSREKQATVEDEIEEEEKILEGDAYRQANTEREKEEKNEEDDEEKKWLLVGEAYFHGLLPHGGKNDAQAKDREEIRGKKQRWFRIR